jgi:hypothetical protein
VEVRAVPPLTSNVRGRAALRRPGEPQPVYMEYALKSVIVNDTFYFLSSTPGRARRAQRSEVPTLKNIGPRLQMSHPTSSVTSSSLAQIVRFF